MASLQEIKVWVLAPSLITNDSNIDYYYDFSQSIEEYKQVFATLNIEWQWQPVTINDYKIVIDTIANNISSSDKTPLILNLCDGDEINGTPGVSVIQYLKEKKLLFTGSDEYFYKITTSKVPMKKAFDQFNVTTPAWIAINNRTQNLEDVFNQLGSPVIVKPAVSGGSMGVGIKNVVHNIDQLKALVQEMFDGYRGWQLTVDGIIAEQFIDGPEFTTLIVGSYDHVDTAKVYAPVERIFHESLPATEKFLSFDRLWEIYEEESPMPNDENFYNYVSPDKKFHEEIMQLSWNAYCATRGTGYTRVDIRMDKQTNKMYVLEVNAQCGLSEDENFTSIGAILRLSNKSYPELIKDILEDTLYKSKQTKYKSIKRHKEKRSAA
jgi:D-alanine-D-alanine ligase